MRTLIVDDERLARKEIRDLLEEHSDIEVIGECADPDEAIRTIDEEKPDLVLLDIQMPGKNGFEVLESLTTKLPAVIFVTAHDEYAIRAFQVNALDYLLKPVERDRLRESLDRVREKQGETLESSPVSVQNEDEKLRDEDRIFLKDRDQCWFVPLSEIRLFESEGNYVRVRFRDEKPLVLKSLNDLEKRLDPKSFFRASRKSIINLKWVDSIENWFNGRLLVRMKGGEEVEISRRQAARFKELMSL